MKKVLIGISLLLSFNSFAQRQDPREVKVSGYELASKPNSVIIAKYSAIELAEIECHNTVTRSSDWKVEEITRIHRPTCYGCDGHEYEIQYTKASAKFKCN